MTPMQVIRAAIPGANDADCEYVLWGRTPFPFKKLTARDIYRAAAGWRRACASGRVLCDFCHNVAESGDFACKKCRTALQSVA